MRRIGHAGSKTHASHGSDIDEIISHITDLVQGEAKPFRNFLEAAQFVTDILMYLGDTQFAGAACDNGTVTASNQHYGDATRFEQTHPITIYRRHTFKHLTLLA